MREDINPFVTLRNGGVLNMRHVSRVQSHNDVDVPIYVTIGHGPEPFFDDDKAAILAWIEEHGWKVKP